MIGMICVAVARTGVGTNSGVEEPESSSKIEAEATFKALGVNSVIREVLATTWVERGGYEVGGILSLSRAATLFYLFCKWVEALRRTL